MMARVWAVLTIALLTACAVPPKKPVLEAWPEYSVAGSIGVFISLPEMSSLAIDRSGYETAARLELAADKKRKAASDASAAAGASILFAPLAVFGIVNPMMFQPAAMPFAYGDLAQQAAKDADRLQTDAAKIRQDSACTAQLAAMHPAIGDEFQRILSDASLGQMMAKEIGGAVQDRTGLPVVSLGTPDAKSRLPFVNEASTRQLPNMLDIEVRSVYLVGELRSGTCGFKITADVELQW